MILNYSGHVVLYSLLVLTLTADFSIETRLNWFEAQEQCMGRGGLTINTKESIKLYWTGRYRRITPWIKIKGCYKDSFLSKITIKVNRTMIRKSVGICQEICERQNTTMFAVKAKNCICIDGDGATSFSELVDPSNCSINCFIVTNDIYENVCGGNSSYNVFEFQSEEISSDNLCLSLQCTDKKFIPKPCSESLSKVCQNQESSSSGYAKNWTGTMSDCILSANSSYLFGDVDLKDANLACNKITMVNNFAIGWIGVARQQFLNIDEGWELSKSERKSFIECRACQNGSCSYIKCNTTIGNSVYCASPIKIMSLSSRSTKYTTFMDTEFEASTNGQPTFSSDHSTRYTTDQHTLNIDKDSVNDTTKSIGAEDGNSDTVLYEFLPVTAVLGILIISAVIVILYLRKRNLKNNDGAKKGNSQKITQRSKVISSSPYNDTEEGEYDHLRDTHSRKDQEEDTYQHASAGISNDVADYDTMANSSVIKMTEEEGTYDHAHTSVNKMSEEDGTYDHAHPVNNSNSDYDYGYNMPICETLNDNPYNIS